MPAASRDPHQIHEKLEAAEEYQAPPREHEQVVASGHTPSGAGDPVDVPLLEAQEGRQKPRMSETKPQAHPAPESTVSGKDELADPTDPRATPPGERM